MNSTVQNRKEQTSTEDKEVWDKVLQQCRWATKETHRCTNNRRLQDEYNNDHDGTVYCPGHCRHFETQAQFEKRHKSPKSRSWKYQTDWDVEENEDGSITIFRDGNEVLTISKEQLDNAS